jgi:F420-non-reducing hydrogenase iron-sulfur subunit
MNENDFEPQIVAFCCRHCAYAAADLAGSMRMDYPPSLKIVELPCSGRVDPRHILRAFENGADGVMVAG